MTPDFLLIANEQDITDTIRRRLIRLRMTDDAGIQSDTVEITLDDRDAQLQWPAQGATLKLSLGYQETGRQFLGSFVVDEVAHQGPPNTMTIRAKAADMVASLKAPNTREWVDHTLGDIVVTIAQNHALSPRVSSELSGLFFSHLDQTEESDLHFLTRLSRQFDAVTKPANGFLFFMLKGEAKATSGRPLTRASLPAQQIIQHRMTQAERSKYASVRTFWHDLSTADRIAVVTGSGEPTYTERETYPNATEAADAGRAKLKRLQRGTASLSLTIQGNVDLQAEGKLFLSGLRTTINGDWVIRRVEHQLDATQGFSTRVEADIPTL